MLKGRFEGEVGLCDGNLELSALITFVCPQNCSWEAGSGQGSNRVSAGVEQERLLPVEA